MDDLPTQPSPERLADFEARAEAAYAAMYEARPWAVKDLKDDAMIWLAQAIEDAQRLGLDADLARLEARRTHIAAVYDHQFRGAGWR